MGKSSRNGLARSTKDSWSIMPGVLMADSLKKQHSFLSISKECSGYNRICPQIRVSLL
jgi:hypothetical protein